MHHSPIPTFLNDFLKDALDYVSKQSSKISVLMGDLTLILGNSMIYFVLIVFRPLILQPSRVTSNNGDSH